MRDDLPNCQITCCCQPEKPNFSEVSPLGFEPRTYELKARYSTELSYRDIFLIARKGFEPLLPPYQSGLHPDYNIGLKTKNPLKTEWVDGDHLPTQFPESDF